MILYNDRHPTQSFMEREKLILFMTELDRLYPEFIDEDTGLTVGRGWGGWDKFIPFVDLRSVW